MKSWVAGNDVCQELRCWKRRMSRGEIDGAEDGRGLEGAGTGGVVGCGERKENCKGISFARTQDQGQAA